MFGIRQLITMLALVAQAATTVAHDGDHMISRDEALGLLHKALEGTHYQDVAGFGVEIVSMPNFPQFYFFEGIWNNPKPGSGVAGHWAVDGRTGDVWDPLSCRILSSLSLNIELRKLRTKKGISQKLIKQARRDDPCL